MSETTEETTTVDDTEVADDTTGAPNDAPVPNGTPDETEPEDAESFPRSYVERLRRESAGYRERATKGDTYAQRLHTELVRATGKLADPTDMAFDEAHLDDPDALAAAVDDLLARKPHLALLARKPHLASRRPSGDIGQGASSPSASSVDLAAQLRQRAR